MPEVRKALPCWLAGDDLRTADERVGVYRETARQSLAAGQAAGSVGDGGAGRLTDELIGVVVVGAVRLCGHGAAWGLPLAQEDVIREWVRKELRLTKARGELACLGLVVAYRTLHRFVAQSCGHGARQPTVWIEDCHFARLGLIPDPATG